jgi:hypothetical protein
MSFYRYVTMTYRKTFLRKDTLLMVGGMGFPEGHGWKLTFILESLGRYCVTESSKKQPT